MGRDPEQNLEFGMSADERLQLDLQPEDAPLGELDLGAPLDDFDPLADLDM